jgi:hypothetical protein
MKSLENFSGVDDGRKTQAAANRCKHFRALQLLVPSRTLSRNPSRNGAGNVAREQVNLQFKRGRYYARLGVPVKLREIIGKRELIIALGADKSPGARAISCGHGTDAS